jgi:hypothetical protein
MPKESAQHFSLGQRKKGKNGRTYMVVSRGKHFVWKLCSKKSKCQRGVQQGPSPAPYGVKLGGAKKSKKRSTKKKTPTTSAADVPAGGKRKGRDGKMYESRRGLNGKAFWKICGGKTKCSGRKRTSPYGPSPSPISGGYRGYYR